MGPRTRDPATVDHERGATRQPARLAGPLGALADLASVRAHVDARSRKRSYTGPLSASCGAPPALARAAGPRCGSRGAGRPRLVAREAA